MIQFIPKSNFGIETIGISNLKEDLIRNKRNKLKGLRIDG
jgi:hypothetical protein